VARLQHLILAALRPAMLDVAVVDAVYDSLPVFPLPNFVMFPNTTTQLHIFEPRYRMMTAEVLASSRMMVLVGLKPGWESDYYGSPPVFEVGALVKVVNDERMPDGRYRLHVHCLGRVRLDEIHRLHPYRTARVSLLPDTPCDATVLDAAMARLADTVRSLIVKLGENGAPLAQMLGSTRKPAILVNRLAGVLAIEPADRQKLLEVSDPVERCDRVTDVAGDLLLRVEAPMVDFSQLDASMVN
jgi:Lon protease-like protein